MSVTPVSAQKLFGWFGGLVSRFGRRHLEASVAFDECPYTLDSHHARTSML
jgi:hypothetical protein